MNFTKSQVTNFHNAVYSHKKLSVLYSIIIKIQDVTKSLELQVKDIDCLKEEDILHQNISDFIFAVRHSLSSMQENLNSHYSSHQEKLIKMDIAEDAVCHALHELELKIEDFASVQENKKSVVIAINKILELCLEFALKVDDVEMCQLENACDDVKQVLCSLAHADDSATLLDAILELKKPLPVALELISARFKDLISPVSCDLIISSVISFKRIMPLLIKSVKILNKGCRNSYSNVSRDYLLKQAIFPLENILKAAHVTYEVNGIEEGSEEPGEFVNTIDKILQLQSLTENKSTYKDLNCLMETVVCHSLAVAHLSLPSSQERIRTCCQSALQCIKVIGELEEKMGKESSNTLLSQELHERWESLMVEVENLDRLVNVAVLRLIAELLTAPLQPVYDLLEVATKNILFKMKPSSAGDSERKPTEKQRECNPVVYCSDTVDMSFDLKPFIKAFHEHTDLLYQICRFAAACSTDIKLIYKLQLTVKHLEALDVEIVPAAVTYANNPQNMEASYLLKLFVDEWCYYMCCLQDVLIRVTDVSALLKVIDAHVQQEVHTVVHHMYDQEGNVLKNATKRLKMQALFAVQVITTVLKGNLKETDKQILQDLAKQVRKCIQSIRKSGHAVFQDLTDLEAHRSLKKHSKILSSCIHNLQVAHENIFVNVSRVHNNNRHDCSYIQKDSECKFESSVHQLPFEDMYKKDYSNWGKFSEGAVSASLLRHQISESFEEEKLLKKLSSSEPQSTLDIELTAILDELKSLDTRFTYEDLNSSSNSPDVKSVRHQYSMNSSNAILQKLETENIQQSILKNSFEKNKVEDSSEVPVPEMKDLSIKINDFVLNCNIGTKINCHELAINSKSNNSISSHSSFQNHDHCYKTLKMYSSRLKVAAQNLKDDIEINLVEPDELLSLLHSIASLTSDLAATLNMKENEINNADMFILVKTLAVKGDLIGKLVLTSSSKTNDSWFSSQLLTYSQTMPMLCCQLNVLASIQADQNATAYTSVMNCIEKLLKNCIAIKQTIDLMAKKDDHSNTKQNKLNRLKNRWFFNVSIGSTFI